MAVDDPVAATVVHALPCQDCGTDLAEADLKSDCPGCGRPIWRMLALACVDPSTRTVSADVPCRACEYNLRTQPIAGRCPECARSVVDSLRPDELSVAPADWLRRVASGLGWLLAAMVIWLISRVAAALLPRLGGVLGISRQLTYLGLYLGTSVCLFVACVYLAASGHSRGAMQRRFPGRILCMLGLLQLASAILSVLLPYLYLLWDPGWQQPGALPFSIYLRVRAGRMFTHSATWLLLALMLRHLARRAHLSRYRRLGTLLLLALLIYIVLSFVELAIQFSWPMGSYFGSDQSSLVNAACRQLAFAGAIATLVLCLGLRRRFTAAAAGRVGGHEA